VAGGRAALLPGRAGDSDELRGSPTSTSRRAVCSAGSSTRRFLARSRPL
jgi:hypothetical protein